MISISARGPGGKRLTDLSRKRESAREMRASHSASVLSLPWNIAIMTRSRHLSPLMLAQSNLVILEKKAERVEEGAAESLTLLPLPEPRG